MTVAARSRDRRLWPDNGRVAHRSCEGQTSSTLVDGQTRQVALPVADLCAQPSRAGRLDRQVLLGTPFVALEDRDGWTFGFTGRAEDIESGTHYVGYVASEALGPVDPPTHRISAIRSLIFAAPDLKAPGPIPISFGALLRVVGEDGHFLRLSGGGWVPGCHVDPLPVRAAADPVAAIERFLGTPYLWGGNSAFGIDCSGLASVLLDEMGRPGPGDSDLQERLSGADVGSPADARRGDLVFWKGHVAIAVDTVRLIHANAHHMAVAYEPIDQAIARIAAQGDGPVTRHLRLGGGEAE